MIHDDSEGSLYIATDEASTAKKLRRICVISFYEPLLSRDRNSRSSGMSKLGASFFMSFYDNDLFQDYLEGTVKWETKTIWND